MILTYKRYEEIRNSKGMKDADVAKKAGFHQSVLSDWKRNKSIPKIDKMQKIAEALEIGYYELVGPVGKFSKLYPNRPITKPTEQDIFDDKLLKLYHNATADAQKSVMTLLENSQKENSKSSKEA